MLPHLPKKFISIAIGLFFLAGISLFAGLGYHFGRPANKGGTDRIFLVRDGSTLNQVANNLKTRGFITNDTIFLIGAKLMGYSRKIKAGEYLLNSGMSPFKILDMLAKGEIITHSVTIPEGFSIRQIAELLEKKGLVERDKFLSITQGPDIAERYSISGSGLEGYLYPDTYKFSRCLSTVSIIDVMVRRFWEIVAPLEERAAELGMSIEEVATLASIVEKETGRADERPIIAGVFLNRLKKNMRLESDPTVIYGIKDFNGNLTRRDLTRPTPYNTYVIRGLPSGPIANPGRDAIKAVLYPTETEYLYFVSKNDGSHYFSRTLSEHNRAVRTYQKSRHTKHQKR